MHTNKISGFSLVELLITLGIIGILAAFTVPSVLNPPHNTLNSKQSAMAKDVAFMISSAYEQYRMANATVPTNINSSVLSPYMSYIKLDTSGTTVDGHAPGGGSYACNSTTPCLLLHNGGKLRFSNETFSGSNSTNCVQIVFDPDGEYRNVAASFGLQYELYYDGTIRTRGNAKTNSCHSVVCTFGPNSSYDPSWFTGF